MKLLDLLVQELESWPEGRECAYQSNDSLVVYFDSPIEGAELKMLYPRQIASDRGPSNIVTRGEWQVAKIKSLPFFQKVAAILGEEKAVKELLTAGKIYPNAKELDEAFAFVNTPQGYDFWKDISDSTQGTNELKLALDTITAAMKEANPEQYIRIHPDGSGSVRSIDSKEIFTFANTDSLVKEYLDPPPKFDHWEVLNDRFKWIAKDQDGSWWAYIRQPDLGHEQWEYSGECHSLEILKLDIPCHWSRSLIERPSHT